MMDGRSKKKAATITPFDKIYQISYYFSCVVFFLFYFVKY